MSLSIESLASDEKHMLYEDYQRFFSQHPEYAHLKPVRESFYKLNRLEGLEYPARLEQYNMAAKEQKLMQKHLEDVADSALRRRPKNVGVFNMYDKHALRATVNKKWLDGKNFSDRIWENRHRLADYLANDWRMQFARGDSFQKMVKSMRERFGKQEMANIKRIIRTEGTYIANEAIGMSMEMGDDEYYTYLAIMDEKTSAICSALNGTGPYRWGDRQPGRNFPPMHPNCRSTFEVVVDAKALTQKPESDIVESGAKCYVPDKKELELMPPEQRRAAEHAYRFYNSFIERSQQQVVDKIYNNIKDLESAKGLTKEDVRRAHQHVFRNEYDLAKGRGRFDPDPDMAKSWQQLYEGKNIRDHDMTMLRHERQEYDYMNRDGMDYSTAHEKTDLKYNYGEAVEAYKARRRK